MIDTEKFKKLIDWHPEEKYEKIKEKAEKFLTGERKDKGFKFSRELDKLKKIVGQE